MSNKLLIISGPTATGKTALAVEFAKKFNGELVSSDSCQIYKGMDIGTGKDQPTDTPIHLIDLINPDIKYSVTQFRKIALDTIAEIQSRGKLPIVVGCSGFYTDSITNPNYDTFSIKPNKILRFFLNKFSVSKLQKIYKFLDKNNFESLNNSDRNNPHRLIRKIEINLSKTSPFFKGRYRRQSRERFQGFDTLHISLTAPMQLLYARIDKRVHSRMEEGFLDEVKTLLKKYKWTDPGMQIGAYQCMKPYFENIKTSPFFKGRCPTLPAGRQEDREVFLAACLQKWKFAEHSDARRQSAIFKSKGNAVFTDITDPKFPKNVIKIVSQWYNKS